MGYDLEHDGDAIERRWSELITVRFKNYEPFWIDHGSLPGSTASIAPFGSSSVKRTTSERGCSNIWRTKLHASTVASH
jgi:hypothetical protein